MLPPDIYYSGLSYRQEVTTPVSAPAPAAAPAVVHAESDVADDDNMQIERLAAGNNID